jgi:hypothetical protein
VQAAAKPQGKAMYVAPEPDWVWLLNEQRKLFAQGREPASGRLAKAPMESAVLNERGTPGSAEGAQKPSGVSRERR